ncbi:radical SAM protein [Flavihumibacter petaseus]|uniref:Radical SAM core domain-containing protein n=1 Tax=Flavihumibacter petaseus NBRC 106054 TaxID=1220578 RepID=A0A0E9MTU5_9BACT|nr:radical SAM protein [Flavihumibacter petaseus]GAO41197.1 hypothetical protein FPE01S_01_02090 [Flavihumibacter petaseus NBRC 106054]
MYKKADYIRRGLTFLNNQFRPSHKRLSTLMIYATDLCDSACKHCLIWAKRPVNFLPKEKIYELMKSECITSQTSVGLEGGEFMLHPDALEILEWFTVNHPNFDLLSNCLKPDTLIEAVQKFPPRHLYISLDGDEETYLHMRGKNGYGAVISVIEALHDKLPVSVMFTLTPYNDFKDLEHVAQVCKSYGIDMRVGIYNDIAFFDTFDKAHETGIGEHKNEPGLKFTDVSRMKEEGLIDKIKSIKKAETIDVSSFPKHDLTAPQEAIRDQIPEIVKSFAENYDFMVLYNEWRQGGLKMRCYSILDSLVVLPNGDVPICQNLDLMIGNIFKDSLDTVFNSKATQKIQQEYVHNCNQCWLNFHRKYDVILYRTFEKYFGMQITRKLFGYYQWEETAQKRYREVTDS